MTFPTTGNKTIVLADDHPIFRRGLVEVVSEDGQYEVVADVSNGREAVEAILSKQPDFAILDISMPVMDGFDVLITGQKWLEPPLFVMLTMYDDKEYLHKALECGAKGYILKDNAEQELINCLDMVGRGKYYLSPGVACHLVDSQPSVLAKLTPTERKIFFMVSEFKTNAEIANLLSVSVRTIENHRAHVCKKLGLSGPHALTLYIADLDSPI